MRKSYQKEYLNRAKEFATKKDKEILGEVVGNFFIRYDPRTREVLVGHIKDRQIRTYYIADNRDADPFVAAIKYAEGLLK